MKVAAIQLSLAGDPADNVARVVALVRRAAAEGAEIILPPELFERPYFCKTQRAEFLEYAAPLSGNLAARQIRQLAAELRVVIPFSFYELAGNVRFNSVAIIDADGEVLGVYRKSHIPDGPGYQEKFYFSPGDTGFRAWRTARGVVGVGVCWDQWFPEAARAMALAGAEVLLYPTAIGDEPQSPGHDSSAHWQNAMRGHAAANVVPVVAANRVGRESQQDAFGNEVAVSFYGRSFIADETGEIAADASGEDGAVVMREFSPADIARRRAAWGLFRDRRAPLYAPLLGMGA